MRFNEAYVLCGSLVLLFGLMRALKKFRHLDPFHPRLWDAQALMSDLVLWVLLALCWPVAVLFLLVGDRRS